MCKRTKMSDLMSARKKKQQVWQHSISKHNDSTQSANSKKDYGGSDKNITWKQYELPSITVEQWTDELAARGMQASRGAMKQAWCLVERENCALFAGCCCLLLFSLQSRNVWFLLPCPYGRHKLINKSDGKRVLCSHCGQERSFTYNFFLWYTKVFICCYFCWVFAIDLSISLLAAETIGLAFV